MLVQGASRLARVLGISTLVVGLTVVSSGTSAPELIVSLLAALGGQSDVAVSNVVGSNVGNIALVLAVAAVIFRRVCTPGWSYRKLPGWSRPPFLLLLLAPLGLKCADGAILLGGLVAYLIFLFCTARSTRTGGRTGWRSAR
ncbi:sodium:calcium antiporter [Deinococcus peraridilitoris]|uniref:Ca2+/Na+ antiporter n=1 Tax=Deinococcus peraridilitoris (strain DSM 19664 / LMG 22246 / CIP 109416 / KR-200) TaxID=937777 RepID=L0A5A9_DEIPD|nr:Ca2+/Na+ antiporter [Deinococcus peraridilitoris]AFZ69056.1 Ca2+/Na+ antiporter [Deinococcus peraridilitoris DSM 19664]